MANCPVNQIAFLPIERWECLPSDQKHFPHLDHYSSIPPSFKIQLMCTKKKAQSEILKKSFDEKKDK